MNRRGFMGMLAGLPGCAWLISKGVEPTDVITVGEIDGHEIEIHGNTFMASTESGFIDGKGVFRVVTADDGTREGFIDQHRIFWTEDN